MNTFGNTIDRAERQRREADDRYFRSTEPLDDQPDQVFDPSQLFGWRHRALDTLYARDRAKWSVYFDRHDQRSTDELLHSAELCRWAARWLFQ